jgi:hypothetical protein
MASARILRNNAGVSETDPFSDAAFTSRLNKLLPMLGSAQAAEADTARRKLMEHLGQHRLSFTDLAQRLRNGAERPSFFQGGMAGSREMSLERQLAIARNAKQEAAAEAIAATNRAHALEVSLQQATFETARVLSTLARARFWAAAGWTVAAICLCLVAAPRLWPLAITARQHRALQIAANDAAMQPADPFADVSLRVGPGEQPGSAAVQDLPILVMPNDDANVRAFLNRGERLVIQQQVRAGAKTWFLVRSATGTGWVRAGDVIH